MGSTSSKRAHVVVTEEVRGRDRPLTFVAVCACGWRSRQLMTAGMAASAAGSHADDVVADAGDDASTDFAAASPADVA